LAQFGRPFRIPSKDGGSSLGREGLIAAAASHIAGKSAPTVGMKVGKDGLIWFLEGHHMTRQKAGAPPRPSHRVRWRLDWPPRLAGRRAMHC